MKNSVYDSQGSIVHQKNIEHDITYCDYAEQYSLPKTISIRDQTRLLFEENSPENLYADSGYAICPELYIRHRAFSLINIFFFKKYPGETFINVRNNTVETLTEMTLTRSESAMDLVLPNSLFTSLKTVDSSNDIHFLDLRRTYVEELMAYSLDLLSANLYCMIDDVINYNHFDVLEILIGLGFNDMFYILAKAIYRNRPNIFEWALKRYLPTSTANIANSMNDNSMNDNSKISKLVERYNRIFDIQEMISFIRTTSPLDVLAGDKSIVPMVEALINIGVDCYSNMIVYAFIYEDEELVQYLMQYILKIDESYLPTLQHMIIQTGSPLIVRPSMMYIIQSLYPDSEVLFQQILTYDNYEKLIDFLNCHPIKITIRHLEYAISNQVRSKDIYQLLHEHIPMTPTQKHDLLNLAIRSRNSRYVELYYVTA
jgi:hypothetical protein